MAKPENTTEAAAGDLLAAALAYASDGLPVLPLKGKVPRISGGLTRASSDVAVVAEWWRRWPDANIGIRTGSASGYVVLDVDVPAGLRSLAELERRHGKLDTATVLTGSGGRHLWFRHPGREIRNSAGALGVGLDVRGDGGYVVVPPSVHESGNAYKWTRELAAATEFPAALLDDSARRRNGRADPVDETIPEGRRRQELLSGAGTLRRRGLNSREILAALAAVNERCVPPLPQAELERLASDVAGRYQPAENSFPPPIDKERGGNETESGGELPFAALATTIEAVPPEPAWLVRGYLAPSAITLLAGRPKVGKSTLAFALLAAISAAAEFAGLETGAAGILLLTEERRDTLAAKARALRLIDSATVRLPKGGGNEFRAVHVLMRHDAGATAWPEIVRQAIAYCVQHELAVLVIDTWDRWTSLRGDAENAAGAVNEALEPLQYAAAAGLAVLLVSHQRKSVGEFGEAVRGSNALTGGVDVVVELERPARSLQLGSQARVLRAVSRFDSTPEELYLGLGDDGFATIEQPRTGRRRRRTRPTRPRTRASRRTRHG